MFQAISTYALPALLKIFLKIFSTKLDVSFFTMIIGIVILVNFKAW